MQAELNAAGVLAPAAATVLLLWKFGSRPTTPWRMLLALVVFLALWAFRPSHLCGAGQPLTQWLVPGLGIFLVLSFVRPKLARYSAAVVFLALSFFLSEHFIDLVHTDGFTGNPEHPEESVLLLQRSILMEFTLHDREAEPPVDPGRTFPPGWLDDLLEQLEGKRPDPALHSLPVAGRAWYTPITGLYPLSAPRKCRIWFPGGTLGEGAEGLEIREVESER